MNVMEIGRQNIYLIGARKMNGPALMVSLLHSLHNITFIMTTPKMAPH